MAPKMTFDRDSDIQTKQKNSCDLQSKTFTGDDLRGEGQGELSLPKAGCLSPKVFFEDDNCL